VIQEAEALQDVVNFMLSIQVTEDAVEKGESKEKREESGGKGKKIPKFNWAEDVDMSIGLVNIVHNTPTAVANSNTSGDVFPIACSATAPTTLTAVTSVDNPKAVVNPVNTTANTPIDAIPIPRDFSAL